MSYLAEDFDEIKDLRDQHLKNHPSFEAQNLLTGFVFTKVKNYFWSLQWDKGGALDCIIWSLVNTH